MTEPWTASEPDEIIDEFTTLLRMATGDGAAKRRAGEKPSWKVDDSHEGAIFSHLTKWKRGEKIDPDSGAHPLVHAAWRCLAIAWQETHATPSGGRLLAFVSDAGGGIVDLYLDRDDCGTGSYPKVGQKVVMEWE